MPKDVHKNGAAAKAEAAPGQKEKLPLVEAPPYTEADNIEDWLGGRNAHLDIAWFWAASPGWPAASSCRWLSVTCGRCLARRPGWLSGWAAGGLAFRSLSGGLACRLAGFSPACGLAGLPRSACGVAVPVAGLLPPPPGLPTGPLACRLVAWQAP